MSDKFVLGCVNNLMFTTRIGSIVNDCGYSVQWIDVTSLLQLNLHEFINSKLPSLIIIDLGVDGVVWEPIIFNLKSTPKSSNIPIICFGSHKETDKIKSAKNAGADQVLARSRFFSSLPEIISKYG